MKQIDFRKLFLLANHQKSQLFRVFIKLNKQQAYQLIIFSEKVIKMFDKMWKTLSVKDPAKNTPTIKLKPKEEGLPTEISAKILDLQIQMQGDSFPNQLVNELLRAYTVAVQFYEERGNPKHKLYQKRMKDFLQKPVIYKMLQGQKNRVTIQREAAHDEEIKRASYRTKEQVSKILSMTSQNANKQKLNINQSLQEQEESLQERMRKRRVDSSYSNVSGQEDPSNDNEESAKKDRKMDINFLLAGIQPRTGRRKLLL